MSKRRRQERAEARASSPSKPEKRSIRPRPSAPRDYGVWVASALVVAAIGMAYGNSLSGPFIFDDPCSITNNPTIRHLWRIGQVLSPPGGGVPVQGRPFVNLTLAVNYALGGTEVVGYHLFNIAFHIVAALTLLGVVRRTLLLPVFADRFRASATGYAAAAALVWGLHPLATEAVTYVVQRTELLYSLFYLLALYCCIRGYGGDNARQWFAAAVASCLVGMACKEAMATAPLMILLYDRVFVLPSWKEVFQRRWRLYAGLAATWSLLGLLMIPDWGSRGGSAGFGAGVTAWEYARTQLWGICRYLRLALWPRGLVVDYGTWIARTPGEIVPSAIILMGLVALTAAAYWQWPWAGFLGTWFFVILAPTSSVVPVATQTLAEKRAYLPLAGVTTLIVFAVGMAGEYLLNRMAVEESLRWRRARALAFGFLACVAVTLGTLTFVRNRDYRSELSIWAAAVRTRPQNPRAYINRAAVYRDQKDFDNAFADCEKAIELNPLDGKAYIPRGNLWFDKGDKDRAIADYTRTIELRPDEVQAYMNRGNAHRDRGDSDRAMADYSKAIELQPAMAEGYNNRGLLYARMGALDKARDDFSKAIACDPDYAGLYTNRADLWNSLGEYQQAIQDCNKAIELNPKYADSYINRGIAFGFLGKGDQALADYSKAIELDPKSEESYNNRGGLYVQAGDYGRALQDLSKAIELKPDYGKAYANRAVAYYYLKDYDKAWADVNKTKTLGTAAPAQLLERLSQAQPDPTKP